MMKKAVPLSMLLVSALGQNYFEGTWTAPANPILPTNVDPKCCYYTGNVAILVDAVSGKTNTASPSSTATGSPKVYTGPCAYYLDAGQITTPGNNADWGQTLATPAAKTSTNGASVGAQTAGASWTLTNNDNTLTFVPSANTNAAPTTSCSQVFTRQAFSIAGVTGATGVAQAGTGGNTCCFVDTTKPVTLAKTTDNRATITATFGAQCTGNTGEQTQYLKAGPAGNTGEVVAVDNSGQYKYTLSADKKTLTFASSNSCSQPITVTLTSTSSANKLAAMTSVVVGAAVLGLAAI